MKKLLVACGVLLFLSACGTLTKDKLGLGRSVPDENMVTTRKPLSIPPEYDLRPVSDDFETQNEEITSLEDVFVKN